MAKIKQAIEEYVPDFRLIDERGPTPERLKYSDSPINVALARQQINPLQYAAAQKLYAHWFHGWKPTSIPSVDFLGVFSDFRPTDKLPKSDRQQFHRQSYVNAMQALADTKNWKYSFVVENVVLKEISLQDVTAQVGNKILWRNRPQAFAVTVEALRDGLDVLGRKFGII